MASPANRTWKEKPGLARGTGVRLWPHDCHRGHRAGGKGVAVFFTNPTEPQDIRKHEQTRLEPNVTAKWKIQQTVWDAMLRTSPKMQSDKPEMKIRREKDKKI